MEQTNCTINVRIEIEQKCGCQRHLQSVAHEVITGKDNKEKDKVKIRIDYQCHLLKTKDFSKDKIECELRTIDIS